MTESSGKSKVAVNWDVKRGKRGQENVSGGETPSKRDRRTGDSPISGSGERKEEKRMEVIKDTKHEIEEKEAKVPRIETERRLEVIKGREDLIERKDEKLDSGRQRGKA